MNKNFLTLALAASVITTLAACNSNGKNDSRKSMSALTEQGEKNVTKSSLASIFTPLQGRYSATDTSLASKLENVSIEFKRQNKSADGSISTTGEVDVSVQLVGSEASILLATLDDISKLKLNQSVDLVVVQNTDVATAFGAIPTAKMVCLQVGNGCERLGVLFSVLQNKSENGAISTQISNAGFVFNGTTLEMSQPGLQSVPST